MGLDGIIQSGQDHVLRDPDPLRVEDVRDGDGHDVICTDDGIRKLFQLEDICCGNLGGFRPVTAVENAVQGISEAVLADSFFVLADTCFGGAFPLRPGHKAKLFAVMLFHHMADGTLDPIHIQKIKIRTARAWFTDGEHRFAVGFGICNDGVDQLIVVDDL